MAKLAKVLKSFTLFVDGYGYGGKCDEVTPPKLTIKTEEWRGGAMDAPLEMDMGQELMTLEAQMSEHDPAIWAQWGLGEGSDVAMTLRGSQGHGTDEEPIVLVCRGMIKELDPGSWKIGDTTKCKLTLSLNYYKATISGTTAIEIDVLNAVRSINGTDVLAQRRQNLGLE